jgi:hypothetical protein
VRGKRSEKKDFGSKKKEEGKSMGTVAADKKSKQLEIRQSINRAKQNKQIKETEQGKKQKQIEQSANREKHHQSPIYIIIHSIYIVVYVIYPCFPPLGRIVRKFSNRVRTTFS